MAAIVPEQSRGTWYLTLLRAAVFVGTAIIFAVPLAGNSGIVAAALAAAAGVLLAPRAAAARYRWPLLAIAFSAIALLGLALGTILGNLPGVAWALGPGLTLRVIEALTFGLLTFAAVLALRTLALRVPACAVFEAATVLGVVDYAFHLHRQYPFSQPQVLADWAISRGYDPRQFLSAIGVAVLAGIAFLLLPRLRPLPALGAILSLVLFSGCFFLIFTHWSPTAMTANQVMQRKHRSDKARAKPKAHVAGQPKSPLDTQPKPSPGIPPKPSSGTQPKPPADTKPKTPADTKPKPPAETKPKSPDETKPKPPADTKPKPPAETKPKPPADSKPKPPAETKAKPPAETKPKPPTETTPKPPAETKPKPPADTNPRPPAETKPKPPPDTKPKPPADTKPKPPLDTKPNPPTDTKPNPPTDTKPKPPAETKPKPPAETKPKPPADTKPKPPLDTKPNPPTDTKPKPPAETKPKPPAETKPKPPAETKPKPPPDTKPKPPADTKPKPPAETKPKPPAETKPKPPPPAKLKPPLGARPKPPHPAKPKPPPAFKPKAPLAAKLKAPHPAKPKPPPAARLKPPRIARLKPPRAATPKPPPPSQDSTKVAFDWGMTKPSPLRPILLMTLHDDYTPLKDSGYYLRTGAVSRLENNRLMPATDMDTDVVWSIPTVPVDRPVAGPKDIFKDLPATIYLIGAGDAAPGLANPFHMEPGENPNPQAFSAAYQVTSRVLVDPKRKGTVVDVYSDLLSLSAGDVAWKDQVRRHYLALPIDRRYRQLAEEIAGALSPAQQRSPLCRALAVRRWMQENLTYDYNPRHKDAPDPVASFLFGDRRGYCTHLSHTMAYLLRAQGVPARVGVGFLVRPERCGKRSAMMAYTGDAHAWAEMYLEGAGWVVVESATKGRIPPPDPTPDPHETDYYLSLLGETPALPDEPEDDAYAAWPYRLMFPFSLVLTLGLVYSPKIYRRLAVRFAADNRLYRVGYRAVLDRLAEVGVQRGAGDTWDEFAATVAGWAPEFAELTEAHLCGAFAGGRRFDRRQWLARLAAVRGRIAATVPASRRIAGLLNPLSWIGVK